MNTLRTSRLIASIGVWPCAVLLASLAANGDEVTSPGASADAARQPAGDAANTDAQGESNPSKVAITETESGFQLLRNGEPFFIKGAGGRGHLDTLAASGANSIRTWHARHLGSVLDEAQRNGLSVCAGLWLGHEKRGFDYSNTDQVARLKEHVRRTVTEHQNHPALLLWGVGNEMEGDGGNPAIWQTVNDIARLIKELDPNHPTMTVIAGTGRNKLRQFDKYCPDVDMVGINAYGDLNRIPPAIKKQELSRPYVITEFGPVGWWQVPKTSWGAELEPTSTEKAKTYRASYEAAVSSQPGKCLGSYAFLWGDKQEHTHTWFGMLLESGERTASVDAMTQLWSGKPPANRCPTIQPLALAPTSQNAKRDAETEHIYAPGTTLVCRADADDPDGDAVAVHWELRSESTDKRTGGYREKIPGAHPDVIIAADGSQLTFKLPEEPGPYRLFATVTDGNGNAATANVPILAR